MDKRRKLYWTALTSVGVVSFALHAGAAWLWIGERFPNGLQGLHRWGGPRGMPDMAGHMGSMAALSLAFWFAVLVVGGLYLWHRRSRPARIDPLADLAGEYVEGRLDREAYLARRTILEEQR